MNVWHVFYAILWLPILAHPYDGLISFNKGHLQRIEVGNMQNAYQKFPFKIGSLKAINWGPISEADLTFGDITLLIGPQNCGKTYLALLTSLLKELFEDGILRFSLPNSIVEQLKNSGFKGYVSRDLLANFVKNNINDIIDYIRSDALKRISYTLLNNLVLRYYSIPVDKLIRYGEKDALIGITFKDENVTILHLEIRVNQEMNAEVTLDVSPKMILSWLEAFSPEITIHEKGWSLSYTDRYIFIPKESIYIPAERVALFPMLAEVTSLVISILRELQEHETRGIFRIREPIFKYLRILNNVLRHEQLRCEILDYGELILSDRELTYHDFIKGADIPISCAGSGIMQTAGIILPIKFSNPNLVIVEEPEINLHADAQLKISEYLAELSNRSQLLITTHSHYLLAKLANLHAKGEIANFMPYFIDVISGKTKKLEISKETGEVELPSSIKEALDALAKESIELSEKIYGREI